MLNVELLIVGSGAGAMFAAIKAQAKGANVLVIEKSEYYGGSSALGAGGMWIPNNDLAAQLGIRDSAQHCKDYLNALAVKTYAPQPVPGSVTIAIEKYVTEANGMYRDLLNLTAYRGSLNEIGDFYSELSGGKKIGRAIFPDMYDGKNLRREFHKLQKSHPLYSAWLDAVGLEVNNRTYYDVIRRSSISKFKIEWFLETLFIIARAFIKYLFNFDARFKVGWRDSMCAGGRSLVAVLREELLRKNIPLWTECSLEQLEVNPQGVVIGAHVKRGATREHIRTNKAVLLACGGYPRNQQYRNTHVHGSSAAWSASVHTNSGDGIEIAVRDANATMDLMDKLWGIPTTLIPGHDKAWPMFIERGIPNSIIVNSDGKRFVNESAHYFDVGASIMQQFKANKRCFYLCDADARRHYFLFSMWPGFIQPDWFITLATTLINFISVPLRKFLPNWLYYIDWWSYVKKAPTLDVLAASIGINPATLSATVNEFNAQAREGVDRDFHRGETAQDIYASGTPVTMTRVFNSAVSPLDNGPFYVVEIHPGDIGTVGGLATNEVGQVKNNSGGLIKGLYAAGNCAASPLGPMYPGPGGTIGPSMVFSYLAIMDAYP